MDHHFPGSSTAELLQILLGLGRVPVQAEHGVAFDGAHVLGEQQAPASAQGLVRGRQRSPLQRRQLGAAVLVPRCPVGRLTLFAAVRHRLFVGFGSFVVFVRTKKRKKNEGRKDEGRTDGSHKGRKEERK